MHPFLEQLDAVCPQKDLQTPLGWGFSPHSPSPPRASAPAHSQQMLPLALATEGNFSLKLELGAAQLSAFSPRIL